LSRAEQRSHLASFQTQVHAQPPRGPGKSRLLRICEQSLGALTEAERLELIPLIEKMEAAL
jgi:hypothetical protein